MSFNIFAVKLRIFFFLIKVHIEKCYNSWNVHVSYDLTLQKMNSIRNSMDISPKRRKIAFYHPPPNPQIGSGRLSSVQFRLVTSYQWRRPTASSDRPVSPDEMSHRNGDCAVSHQAGVLRNKAHTHRRACCSALFRQVGHLIRWHRSWSHIAYECSCLGSSDSSHSKSRSKSLSEGLSAIICKHNFRCNRTENDSTAT